MISAGFAYNTGCQQCQMHVEHMDRVTEARTEYRRAWEREWTEDEYGCSADLMKITLIPVLPHKATVFTPRLVVFNETFAPLENHSKPKRARSVTVRGTRAGREGIAGRDGVDLAAA